MTRAGSPGTDPVASGRVSADLPLVEPPIDSAAHRFGELIRERSRGLGHAVTITTEVWSAGGGHIVRVDASPDLDLLFEVDDWVEGVRVLDPDGDDVTVAEAVGYFAARATGQPREQARRLAFNG